ncbi:MAG: nucleotidyltransferase domain-containing protein [Candidatus Micrarchaeota archaeon]
MKDLLDSKRVVDVLVGLNALDRLSQEQKNRVAPVKLLRRLSKRENVYVWRTADAELYKRKHPETTAEYLDGFLRVLFNDENKVVGGQAVVELTKRWGRRWLLGSQKPVFATDFKKELVVRLKRLEEVAAQLKKEFGRNFVGVTVVGGTAKGYATPESDLDYAVIASNPKVLARFRELAEDLRLCAEHYVSPASPENKRFLFHGLFFGDRKLLEQHQAEVVNNISEESWNSIREKIADKELELSKASSRFGLSDAEAERLALAARLLRVPPELSEVKDILRRRLKRAG